MSDPVPALKRGWHWIAAAGLLAFQCLLMALFIAASSPTYDEPAHLSGGLNNLKNFDFSINPESGALIQDWLALPNLGLKFPPQGSLLPLHAVCYKSLIHPAIKAEGTDKVYAKSRVMAALLNVACGLLLLLIASKAAGRLPGLLAYGLYCSTPLLLSNGALATADMGATFAALLCCAAFWRLLSRPSALNALLAGLAAAAFATCKNSSALMAPAVAAMLALRSFAGARIVLKLPFAKNAFRVAGALKGLGVSLAGLALAGLVAWGAVWAVYGFRYSQSPEGGTPARALPLETLDDGGAVSKAALEAMRLRLLPEAFLYGFMYTNSTAQKRMAFLNGELSMTGFRSFFPQAFAMKTPPGEIAAIAVGLAALLWGLKSRAGRARAFLLAPYLAFAAIYLAFALSSKLNIGARHLMPALPALLLLAALGFRALLRVKACKPLPFLLLAWCLLEAAIASPRLLSYFSPLYGGTAKAHERLVDSSLDWGQDLKNLKGDLEKAGVKTDGGVPVHFCYLGLLDARECGFDAKILPMPMSGQFGSGRGDLTPGVYCLSATTLRGINLLYTETDKLEDPKELEKLSKSFREIQRLERGGGSLDELKRLIEAPGSTAVKDCYDYELLRFELLRRRLAKREPFGSSGGSILFFSVSAEELSEALAPLLRAEGRRNP